MDKLRCHRSLDLPQAQNVDPIELSVIPSMSQCIPLELIGGLEVADSNILKSLFVLVKKKEAADYVIEVIQVLLISWSLWLWKRAMKHLCRLKGSHQYTSRGRSKYSCYILAILMRIVENN